MTTASGFEIRRATKATFPIDLNGVRGTDRAASLVGLGKPPLVGDIGETVVATDEDGASYDATVVETRADHTVVLEIDWSSRTESLNLGPLDLAAHFSTRWSSCS